MEPALQSRPTESAAAKRILTGLSTLAVMLVIYGSWLPFEFQTEAISRSGIALLSRITWAPSPLEDAVTNILIFIPIGLFVSMRLRLTAKYRGVRVILPFVLAAMTSLVSETGQTVIPQRSASYTDMMLHGVGTLIGMALALLAFRLVWYLVKQLKVALALRPQWALFGIVATLVVFAKLAPFDLTIRPADFAHSLATARWSPFDPAHTPSQNVLEDIMEVAGSFFVFVLLGVLGAKSLREIGVRPSVSAVNTIAKLILLAVGLELIQIVIVSHTCDAADALCYVYGAVVGSVLGATLMDRQRWRGVESSRTAAEHVLLTAALVVQCVMVVGYAFPVDGQWVTPSTESIQWIPFYAQFNKPFATGVGQIVSSLMWYATLAIIAATVMSGRVRRRRPRSGSDRLRRRLNPLRGRFMLACFLTVSVVTLTEAMQAFSLTRFADVTEPLLALAASLAATAACRWVERHRQTEPQTAIVELL